MLAFITFIGVVGFTIFIVLTMISKFKKIGKVKKDMIYAGIKYVIKFAAADRVVTVKKITLLLIGLLFTCGLLLPGTQAQAAMVIDSFDGPVTQNEINSFKSEILTLQPVVWPNTTSMQSEYAQGKSGESIKAMGLMYEITGDTAILDRMIYFCDVLLSQRNDILAAPYGQRTVWTNTVAPVWPGSTTDPAAADSANGDPVGHLAYCARLILQHPSIWNTSVPIGDTYGHGATYRQRADTFITEADYVISQFIFPQLLDLSRGNKYYFSTQSPYMSGAIMPWNQQMMISYGLQNLAAAHAIAGDNASLVSQYDGIVQTNLNWFFSDNTAKQTYTDSKGTTAYNWGYNPTLLGAEDSNHASLDVAGYYRAFLIGRYGITAAMMTPFANMYADVMMRGPNDFAGRVDGTDGTGHGAPTTYARSGNFFLTALRPDMYYALANADLPNKTTTSMDTFSRFMWAKNKRTNLALGKTYNASTTWSTSYTANKAFDGDASTRWSASSGSLNNQWLSVDFGATTTYNQVVLKETSFQRVTSYKLQSSSDGTTYTDIAGTTGTTIGASKTINFSAVTSRYVRMYITSASAEPTINEMEVYNYPNLALSKTYNASTIWSASYTADKAFDGDASTRWSASSGSLNNQWLSVDFGAATTYNQVVLKETSFQRVTSYKLQSSSDGTTYTDIAGTTGTTIGASKTINFSAVTSRYVRVYITSASAEPTINEMEVYNK